MRRERTKLYNYIVTTLKIENLREREKQIQHEDF